MGRHYVRIHSINDIDTAALTVKTIENRYIDAEGRRYATRFNLRTRKIEIVPIALGREEAVYLKRLANGSLKGTETLTHEAQSERRVHPSPMKLPMWINELGIERSTHEVDLQNFLNTAERDIQRNGERYRGLIQSLKMSSVLEDLKDANQHDAILEITNTYERDIQSHAGRVQSLVVEFLRFPKPLASYLGQIDRNCKKYVEKLDPEKQKRYSMAYLLAGEMFALHKGCLDLIEMIERFTAEAKPDRLSYERKSAYESAMQSLAFLKESQREEIVTFLGLLTTSDVI
ncbi:MAG TPA: hypothetical protein PLY93_03045 [Turneriella sp.]|nr:hypothetical protein [Turneriella sp.]